MMTTTKQAMAAHVRELRAAGWRVRDGGWPATLEAEARWDFCRLGENTLGVMTAEARRATDVLDGLRAGERVSSRSHRR
jgi:hypothetical protein